MNIEKANQFEELILKVKDFFVEFTKKVVSLDGAQFNYEFSLSQLKALYAFIHEDKKLTMSELAKNAGVTMPSMTEIVDNLVKQDLVIRSRDESDRRVVNVMLTEKGKKMRKEFMGRRRKELLSVFSRLSEKERTEFVESLGKVKTILEKLNTEEPK